MRNNSLRDATRLLGRVEADEFIGRRAELSQITALGAVETHTATRQSLLILTAPAIGSSELLRQAFDSLFEQRGKGASAPVYFAFMRADKTTLATARRFLYTFLLQVVAHRQDNPSLIGAQPPLGDILASVSSLDYEWIKGLIETYDRALCNKDESSLVRLCLSAPHRAHAHGARSVVMLDHLHLIEELAGEVALGAEIAQSIRRADMPFVLCGLRRSMKGVLYGANDLRVENFTTLHLNRLGDDESRTLFDTLAARYHISVSDQARDLLVQQCAGNPLYITSILDAARETRADVSSFIDCQRLYVDELMGGRINRRFEILLDSCIGEDTQTRRAWLQLLHEAVTVQSGKVSAESWRRKLNLDANEFARTMNALHIHELINHTATFVEVEDNLVWRDYLHVNHRLQTSAEPRALVVAETQMKTLKRASRTMERLRRRTVLLGASDLLARFNRQRVPASLLHYDRFMRIYAEVDAEEIAHGLDTEIDLMRLPQIVHTANCAAFHAPMKAICDPERCTVGHGFEGETYTDASETVWLVAELDAHEAVGRGVAELWCDRLLSLARACNLRRVRLWLIAPEGFSKDASDLLRERDAYSSSRQQLQMLKEHLGVSPSATPKKKADEFELTISTDEDSEIIAAQAVEQVARRIEFSSDAINQIKTAIVEACIIVEESKRGSSSNSDRKIYQHFRIEVNKLIITVSSRSGAGGFPDQPKNGSMIEKNNNGNHVNEINRRRDWGIKLIRSLMDEVEFERGNGEIRLRMTKYLRKQK